MSILVAVDRYPTRIFVKGMIGLTTLKKNLWLFFLLVALSCGKGSTPEGILSKAEMSSLLVELYIAESRITLSRIPRDSAYRVMKPYEDSLLWRRGLTDSTVRKSYAYYLERPKVMEQILDAVIDTLSLREQRAGNQP